MTAGGVSTITRNLYDGANILNEYDGNALLQVRYVHNLGVDDPLSIEKNGGIYYYHKDGLGSVTALTDSTGSKAQSYEYDSFGSLLSQTGTLNQPYTYTGREYDPETGLYYYRVRYYDSRLGKFISKDPIGFAGGDVNVFNYVRGNPVNWVDPDGLFRNFLIVQGVKVTTRIISNFALKELNPAGRRIIGAGIAGATGGAVAGALVGTPVLGIGAAPSALGGAIIGFSGGLLLQTTIESIGMGQKIEDLFDEIKNNITELTEEKKCVQRK